MTMKTFAIFCACMAVLFFIVWLVIRYQGGWVQHGQDIADMPDEALRIYAHWDKDSGEPLNRYACEYVRRHGPQRAPATAQPGTPELQEAIKARQALFAQIAAAGVPPHSDYWSRSICEADERIRAAESTMKKGDASP